MFAAPKYRRVLLKLSGEMLAGEKEFGICYETLESLTREVVAIHELGVQIGIVIGGGNILRGSEATHKGMDRASADYMGMLGTAINALALQNMLEQAGVATRVLSAIEMQEIAEPYIRRRAVRHLEKDRVVIFACGTGNPYFTTDTAASLRAMEISAEVLLKGTKVDAIYDKDPEQDSSAKPYSSLTFMDVLQKELRVMDAAAISLCKDNSLPIIVFNMGDAGNLRKVVTGDDVGTRVSDN